MQATLVAPCEHKKVHCTEKFCCEGHYLLSSAFRCFLECFQACGQWCFMVWQLRMHRYRSTELAAGGDSQKDRAEFGCFRCLRQPRARCYSPRCTVERPSRRRDVRCPPSIPPMHAGQIRATRRTATKPTKQSLRCTGTWGQYTPS